MSEQPDKELECQDCHKTFIFTRARRGFFKRKGFPDPKRCDACAQIKKDKLVEQIHRVRAAQENNDKGGNAA